MHALIHHRSDVNVEEYRRNIYAKGDGYET